MSDYIIITEHDEGTEVNHVTDENLKEEYEKSYDFAKSMKTKTTVKIYKVEVYMINMANRINPCKHEHLKVHIDIEIDIKEKVNEKGIYEYDYKTVELYHQTKRFITAKCINCGKVITEYEYNKLQE